MKKINVYIVYNDNYGQHGTDIIEKSMLENEYKKILQDKYINGKVTNFFITNNYMEVLNYTQD